MPLSSNVKSVVSKKLEEYEGRYNHLYLDSVGKVTVGVGHLISSRVAMASVNLYTTKNNLPIKSATLSEKQAEYDAIAKQKKGYKASWYKQHTKLVMKDTDIVIQKDKHIASFYTELASYYRKSNGYKSDFDSFPEKVQIVLFDMIFNLGLTNLKGKFSKFNDAIKKEDWKEAEKQCNRPQVNDARNLYVKGLLGSIVKTPAAVKP